MSPRKLTEDDKQNMLELYRNSKATTSTLAKEFGVSSSTVSRFLKNSLSQEEYEDLIQQKRLARTPRGDRSSTKAKADTKDTETVAKVELLPAKKKLSARIILSDKNEKEDTPKVIDSDTISVPKKIITTEEKEAIEQEKTQEAEEVISQKVEKVKPEKKIILVTPKEKEESDDDEEIEDVDVAALNAMLGEEIDDEDDEDTDDEDDDDTDDEDYTHTNSKVKDLQILPLSAASFPRTCYLVVDRSAELIVKPLQEFADLGSIPDEEIQQKTLPIFDNHRIAKRFSHRREKVIKVPDGKMLQKTSQYLYDKGITRLLLRGQIYAIYEG